MLPRPTATGRTAANALAGQGKRIDLASGPAVEAAFLPPLNRERSFANPRYAKTRATVELRAEVRPVMGEHGAGFDSSKPQPA
jgi:hypothetical protein